MIDIIGGGGGSSFSYSQSSGGGGRGGYGGGSGSSYSYSKTSSSGGGMRSGSGGSSEFLQRSGGTSGSSEFLQQSGGGYSEEVSSMQQKVATSRTSKGNVAFGKCDTVNGSFIELTAKTETNLRGWSIVKKTTSDSTRGGTTFVFEEDVFVTAAQPLKILKRGSRAEGKGDWVCNWDEDFRSRNGFVLFDDKKMEKASLTQKITMM